MGRVRSRWALSPYCCSALLDSPLHSYGNISSQQSVTTCIDRPWILTAILSRFRARVGFHRASQRDCCHGTYRAFQYTHLSTVVYLIDVRAGAGILMSRHPHKISPTLEGILPCLARAGILLQRSTMGCGVQSRPLQSKRIWHL